jgi:hypothetical protein
MPLRDSEVVDLNKINNYGKSKRKTSPLNINKTIVTDIQKMTKKHKILM